MWMVVAVAALAVGGCGDGGLKPEDVNKLADAVQTLTQQLTVYQAQVTAMAEQMEADGLLTPEKAESVAKLNTEIDKVKGQLADAAEAMRAGTFDPSDSTLLLILKAAQAANAGTAAWNPYAPYIGGALTLIIMILAVFGKKKADQAKTATATLGAVTQAVEAAPPEVQGQVKTAVASNLKAAGITQQGKALISATKAV
jgi:outer membrane murein-binding lipoprotein Lpp